MTGNVWKHCSVHIAGHGRPYNSLIVGVGFWPACPDRLVTERRGSGPGRFGAGPAGVGRRVRTLVALGAVLALGAGLTGRAPEALSTLAHARAVQPVQADPVSKADVLGFPWAGLALGAKEAGTAFSRLQSGWGGQGWAWREAATPPSPGFVRSSDSA